MALIFASPIPARILSSFLQNMLLFTHTCPVTEFAVASHLNTANSCCHHVFLRHFRFQKCLPVYSNQNIPIHVSGSKNRVYDTDALFPYALSVSKNAWHKQSLQNFNRLLRRHNICHFFIVLFGFKCRK